jgi:hypothetical protein
VLLHCYDPQRGHMTLGQNGPGHVMSVQVGRLVIAQVIGFEVSLSLETQDKMVSQDERGSDE